MPLRSPVPQETVYDSYAANLFIDRDVVRSTIVGSIFLKCGRLTELRRFRNKLLADQIVWLRVAAVLFCVTAIDRPSPFRHLADSFSREIEARAMIQGSSLWQAT